MLATPTLPTLSVTVESAALLDTTILPLTVSACFGAKGTSRMADCPAAMVVPLTPPLVVIFVPLTVTPDTVRLAFPVFLRVTAIVCVCPTVTFPKFKLVD